MKTYRTRLAILAFVVAMVVQAHGWVHVNAKRGGARWPNGTVSGHVYEEGTSTGIPGMEVALYKNGSQLQTTVSDPAGAYSFTAPVLRRNQSYSVCVVETEEYTDGTCVDGIVIRRWRRHSAGNNLYLTPVVIPPEYGTISGFLYERGTTNPIVGPRANLYRRTPGSPFPQWLASQPVDSLGAFSFQVDFNAEGEMYALKPQGLWGYVKPGWVDSIVVTPDNPVSQGNIITLVPAPGHLTLVAFVDEDPRLSTVDISGKAVSNTTGEEFSAGSMLIDLWDDTGYVEAQLPFDSYTVTYIGEIWGNGNTQDTVIFDMIVLDEANSDTTIWAGFGDSGSGKYRRSLSFANQSDHVNAIRIYDISGRLVATHRHIGTQTGFQGIMKQLGIRSGHYILRVNNGEKASVQRILILR